MQHATHPTCSRYVDYLVASAYTQPLEVVLPILLRAFLKAYALAAAKCEDFERARDFHKLMTGVPAELKLHGSYSATRGIDLGLSHDGMGVESELVESQTTITDDERASSSSGPVDMKDRGQYWWRSF